MGRWLDVATDRPSAGRAVEGRPVIQAIVDGVRPQPGDVVADPA